MGRRGRMVVEFTTTCAISAYPVHGQVYSIQHYVIKFVNDLLSPGSPVSSTNKTDRHDITEILLKVALNTINPNLFHNNSCKWSNYVYVTILLNSICYNLNFTHLCTCINNTQNKQNLIELISLSLMKENNFHSSLLS
jgi:hypothetical protein